MVKRFFRRVARKAYKVAKKRYGGGKGLYKLARDVYRVKSLINAEFKKVDTTATYTQGTGYTITALNTMAQGDDNTQRNGRSIKQQSNYIRFVVNLNTATQANIRVLLVIKKENDGATLDPAELFQASGQIVSPYNTNHVGEHKVIYDRLFTVNTGSKTIHNVVVSKKLFQHTKFSGTTANITDADKNILYLVTLSDQSGANLPTIAYFNRFRFIDN